MEFSCKILGIIDPHLPYAGHRISKTHEYQLFSGAGCIRQLPQFLSGGLRMSW